MDRKNTRILKDILPDFIKEAGLEAGINAAQVYQAWDKVLGMATARQTLDKKFCRGVLQIRIQSPVLRSELAMQECTIIEAINREIGYKVLQSIQIH